jgi:hypothetical protein
MNWYALCLLAKEAQACVGKLKAVGRGRNGKKLHPERIFCTFAFRKLNDCSISIVPYLPEDTSKL